LNTGRASNTGQGSDIIVLIDAGGFYSRKYGTHAVEPDASEVISEAWFYVAT